MRQKALKMRDYIKYTMLPVQDEAEGGGSVLSGNYTALHKCFNGMIVGNCLM